MNSEAPAAERNLCQSCLEISWNVDSSENSAISHLIYYRCCLAKLKSGLHTLVYCIPPQSLGNYVYRKIISLPPDERPKPKIKAEESRNVILASYPELKPLLPPPSIMPTNKGWKQGWLKNLVNKFTRVGSKHAAKGDW